MRSCTLYYPLGQDELRVIGLGKRCRYHKCEQIFFSTMISPDGLCPAAFEVLYPHCLSMLSRAKYPIAENKEICRVKCPGKPGMVEFNIFRKPFKRYGIERLIFYFKKLVDFFIPVELLEHRLFIEVVRTSDSCPFSYKEGRAFEFNIGDKKEICPAAFYSLYPFYLSFLDKTTNLENSRQAGNLNCQIACSDYNTNIVFQLGSQDKKDNSLSKHYFDKCDDYSHIYVRINNVQNCNNSIFKKGMECSISQLIKDMDIPCYSVFYTAFPYMLTLGKGGSLGFLTFDRNAAGIQCPNLSIQVKMLIKKDRKKDLYFINIFDNRDKCPKGIKKGQIYELPNFSNNKFDIIVLANIFPYVMYLKYLINSGREPDKKFIFCYFNDSSYVEFQIYRKAKAHVF